MPCYTKTTIVMGCVAALAVAVPAFAGEGNNFYINPAIGLQDFDGQRRLDNEKLFSLGLEYRYGKHWAAEIGLMDSSPDVRSSNNDVDLSQYGIDGIYYFKERDYFGVPNKFEPYGAFGIGHAEFDGNNSTNNETQSRLGLGMRYLLSDHWSIKADARIVYGIDDDTRDSLVMLGLSYAFKSQQKSTAAKKVVAVVDGDSDGDGVSDGNDRCPTTPAGVAVDSSGCALDSDGDGVADYKDKCPATPAGRQVDEMGCKYVLMRTEEVTLNVKFPSNSSVVSEGYMAEVQKVANFMNKYGAVNAVIEGHTDSTGSESYNKTLSQRRANAVMQMLVNRFGIAAGRVSAVGYGEARPIDSNDTEAGRQVNRRVIAVMKAEVEE